MDCTSVVGAADHGFSGPKRTTAPEIDTATAKLPDFDRFVQYGERPRT
jgi:hypothetical protein